MTNGPCLYLVPEKETDIGAVPTAAGYLVEKDRRLVSRASPIT
jgi:hypothetical protein